MSQTSARELGLCRCHTCGLLVRFQAGSVCPRCHSRLQVRIPHSLAWSWGLLALASFMLLPANLLPITHFYNKGLLQSDTIFSGIMMLYRSKMSGIATIVLTASIIVPVGKILGLGWICWQLQRSKPVRRKRQLIMYRIIDFIGRWSMLDLFVISLMVALVDRGVLLNVRAGPGATAFAGVVVLTMMSARMLDTRLLWDKAAR